MRRLDATAERAHARRDRTPADHGQYGMVCALADAAQARADEYRKYSAPGQGLGGQAEGDQITNNQKEATAMGTNDSSRIYTRSEREDMQWAGLTLLTDIAGDQRTVSTFWDGTHVVHLDNQNCQVLPPMTAEDAALLGVEILRGCAESAALDVARDHSAWSGEPLGSVGLQVEADDAEVSVVAGDAILVAALVKSIVPLAVNLVEMGSELAPVVGAR